MFYKTNIFNLLMLFIKRKMILYYHYELQMVEEHKYINKLKWNCIVTLKNLSYGFDQDHNCTSSKKQCLAPDVFYLRLLSTKPR